MAAAVVAVVALAVAIAAALIVAMPGPVARFPILLQYLAGASI